jgi:hypothetical protein
MLSFNAFLAAAQWPPEIMEKLLALEKPGASGFELPKIFEIREFLPKRSHCSRILCWFRLSPTQKSGRKKTQPARRPSALLNPSCRGLKCGS